VSERLEIGPPADAAELRAYRRLTSQAFSARPSNDPDISDLLERGLDAFRVARQGGRVAAGVETLALGQWFGGRSVPMTGVAGVVVAPEARAGGLAAAMLRAVLTEERERGAALSMLFTRTPRVYRRVGYEHAGLSVQYRERAAHLPAGDRELALR
jgi:predicted acetyltransferase